MGAQREARGPGGADRDETRGESSFLSLPGAAVHVIGPAKCPASVQQREGRQGPLGLVRGTLGARLQEVQSE